MSVCPRKRRWIVRAIIFAVVATTILTALFMDKIADTTTWIALVPVPNGVGLAGKYSQRVAARTIEEAVMTHASSIQTPESLRINASYAKSAVVLPFGLGEVGFVQTDNTAWWERISKKEWEPYTIQIMQQLVTPESIVVDMGAWMGATPIISALLGAYVFAFEPDPTAFGEMVVNVGLNAQLQARISLHPWCISDKHGNVSMRGFPGDSSGSITARMQNSEFGPTWMVECYTIDEVMDVLHIAPNIISLVKVDIEGAEANLIKPLCSWLQAAGYPPLWLSLHAFAWDDTAAAQSAVLDCMKQYSMVFTAKFEKKLPSSLRASELVDTAMFLLTNKDIVKPA